MSTPGNGAAPGLGEPGDAWPINSLSHGERTALSTAHNLLSQAVALFEDSAYALPGPVPSWLHTGLADALERALRPVAMLAGHPNAAALCSEEFLGYADGLAELERDTLAAFPREVWPDEVRVTTDWTELDRWLEAGP